VSFLKPRVSVGFFSNYNVRVTPVYTKHAADLAFDIAKRIDGSLLIDNFVYPMRVSPDADRAANQLLVGLPTGTRLVVVHPDTLEEKCWSSAGWTSFLDSFLRRHPNFLAAIVGGHYPRLDSGSYGRRVVSFSGLPLDVSIALVKHADLFVGVDSCMLHAADLFGVPGVGLFGPTSCVEWGFRFTAHRRHVFGGQHLRALDAQVVTVAVEDLLAELRAGGTMTETRD
jgi:ADP-heptose:LPS heptosyltransferase